MLVGTDRQDDYMMLALRSAHLMVKAMVALLGLVMVQKKVGLLVLLMGPPMVKLMDPLKVEEMVVELDCSRLDLVDPNICPGSMNN